MQYDTYTRNIIHITNFKFCKYVFLGFNPHRIRILEKSKNFIIKLLQFCVDKSFYINREV